MQNSGAFRAARPAALLCACSLAALVATTPALSAPPAWANASINGHAGPPPSGNNGNGNNGNGRQVIDQNGNNGGRPVINQNGQNNGRVIPFQNGNTGITGRGRPNPANVAVNQGRRDFQPQVIRNEQFQQRAPQIQRQNVQAPRQNFQPRAFNGGGGGGNRFASGGGGGGNRFGGGGGFGGRGGGGGRR